MKIVTLTRKCAHRLSESEKSPRTALKLFTKRSGIPQQAHTYSELRQQIHDDLRIQHPEWVQPDGECPMCDAYEARLIELFDHLGPQADDDPVAPGDPSFEHGLN